MNKKQKRIIEIIQSAFKEPPPETVAARALLKAGYTETDLSGLHEVMDNAWVVKTRNALRDIERGLIKDG